MQRKECVDELWTIKWKEQEYIQQFNSKFNKFVANCARMNFLCTVSDQVNIYLNMLLRDRPNDQTLMTAQSVLREQHGKSLREIMRHINGVVLKSIKDGNVPMGFEHSAYLTAVLTPPRSSSSTVQYGR